MAPQYSWILEPWNDCDYFFQFFFASWGKGCAEPTHVCHARLSLKPLCSPSRVKVSSFTSSSSLTDSVSLTAWGRVGFKNALVEILLLGYKKKKSTSVNHSTSSILTGKNGNSVLLRICTCSRGFQGHALSPLVPNLVDFADAPCTNQEER